MSNAEFRTKAQSILKRCRTALDSNSGEWEEDVGCAIESDARLVKDIDDLLGGEATS